LKHVPDVAALELLVAEQVDGENVGHAGFNRRFQIAVGQHPTVDKELTVDCYGREDSGHCR